MSEHVVELLQIPARAFGHSFEGAGHASLYALLFIALALLALGVFLKSRAVDAFPAAVVGDAAPSAPWTSSPDAALLHVVDTSADEAASAVLAVRIPGGGE